MDSLFVIRCKDTYIADQCHKFLFKFSVLYIKLYFDIGPF